MITINVCVLITICAFRHQTSGKLTNVWHTVSFVLSLITKLLLFLSKCHLPDYNYKNSSVYFSRTCSVAFDLSQQFLLYFFLSKSFCNSSGRLFHIIASFFLCSLFRKWVLRSQGIPIFARPIFPLTTSERVLQSSWTLQALAPISIIDFIEFCPDKGSLVYSLFCDFICNCQENCNVRSNVQCHNSKGGKKAGNVMCSAETLSASLQGP